MHTLAAILLAATSLLGQSPNLHLTERTDSRGGKVREGWFEVWENRATKQGRRIKLHVVVLVAIGKDRRPDPVFWLAGGPGGAATSSAGGLARAWIRGQHDIVLVDQRGTGKSNPLFVRLPGRDGDLQSYFEPLFRVDVFRKSLPELSKHADLTQYTTPIAADDLDDVRAALGYDKINLMGGSYGTRMALVYMRRHENSVRTAILNGVAPISFKNPLFHAWAAQHGLDAIFAEIENDPKKRAAFPDLRAKFATILARLDEKPAKVKITAPDGHTEVEVTLDRNAFCEALRVMMYFMPTNRLVPAMLLRAYAGDYRPFAEHALRSNSRLRNMLALGMLMSVVGTEDIPRITEAEIVKDTAGTFLGDARVRQQMAVAAIWPRGDAGAHYGDPVSVNTPTLLLSGTHDPVTPPRFGAEAAKTLPNSLHLVVPGAHGVGGACIASIIRQVLDKGSVADIDTSCVANMRLPPLRVPKQPAKKRRRL